MKIDNISSQQFGARKLSVIKKLVRNSKKYTDLKVIKNYSQYMEVYGLGKKINETLHPYCLIFYYSNLLNNMHFHPLYHFRRHVNSFLSKYSHVYPFYFIILRLTIVTINFQMIFPAKNFFLKTLCQFYLNNQVFFQSILEQ